MNYEQWIEKYQPIENTLVEDAPFDKYMYETYGEELAHVRLHDVHKIWTIIEDDDNGFWLTQGYRIVNRFGYILTEVLWKAEDYDFECDVFIGDDEDYKEYLENIKIREQEELEYGDKEEKDNDEDEQF